jgi:4-amino-4-deoxy-L-arabinose transferase-like glycosyltransferase
MRPALASVLVPIHSPSTFARRTVAVRSAAMTDRRRLSLLALLIVAASGIYLIGNGSTALWDRDEPRYAQTSRQMLQSGDWVVPHFLDMPRTAKPALIYWCQATAMAVVGDAGPAANFAARLPSALALSMLLIVGSAVLWRRLGPRPTLWTAFIFASSGLTIAAAKMCITDAVLLLWVTVAQLCLYAAWRGRWTWPVVIVWAIMVGLAGLTKGPVILGVQGMTILVLLVMRWVDRRWTPVAAAAPKCAPSAKARRHPGTKVLVALLIVIAIVLPWVLMVNHRASAFLRTTLHHDVWDRMMTPLEQHAGPPGYYLISVWATFFPWSLLLPLAVGVAWRRRADPRSRFALAAVVGPWVMLECVRTKLPHYLLPAFPFLAYLTADALLRCLDGEITDLRGRPFKIVVSAWAVVIAAVASAPWLVIGHFAPLPTGAMTVMSIAGLTFAGAVAVLVWRERLTAAAVLLGTGTLALVALVYGLYLPRADFLRVSPRVARVLIDHGVTQRGQCIMLDYMEPSLAWDQGGTIREAGPVGFGANFDSQFTPWMVMTREVWDRAPAPLQAEFDVVGDDVYGLAYADKGRWVHVIVVHRKSMATQN